MLLKTPESAGIDNEDISTEASPSAAVSGEITDLIVRQL